MKSALDSPHCLWTMKTLSSQHKEPRSAEKALSNLFAVKTQDALFSQLKRGQGNHFRGMISCEAANGARHLHSSWDLLTTRA